MQKIISTEDDCHYIVSAPVLMSSKKGVSSMKENKLSRMSAILSIYHLFRHCREVSYKEITDLLPIGQKTAQRHISLLKRAGLIQIRYSRKAEESVTGEAHWAYAEDVIFNTYSLYTFHEDQEKWQ